MAELSARTNQRPGSSFDHRNNVRKGASKKLKITDNSNTDLIEAKEDVQLPFHVINNTMMGHDISRNKSKVELVAIAPKKAESSIACSSSQTSYYRHPPKVENDEYEDAFRNVNMGPGSQSFVMFTPKIETEIKSKQVWWKKLSIASL